MKEEIFTNHEINLFKRKFNTQLEPYKIMLKDMKHKMTPHEWRGAVEKTRKSILMNPDQYLEKDMVPKILLVSLVNRIFEEYITNESGKSNDKF